MQSVEELYKDITFGTKIGFGNKPALILIDFCYGCTDPDMPIGFDQSEAITKSRVVLEAARANKIPIIYLTVGYEEGGIDGGTFVEKIPALKSQRMGTRAAEIDERLMPHPGEPVILKKYPSGFFGTNLHSLLTTLGVDTTLLVGNSTSGCVRATSIDAISSGFRNMVLHECVADRDPEVHKYNLFDIGAKYADLVTVEEVLQYLDGLPAN